MTLIDMLAGARPNSMKIAPIIKALEARKTSGGAVGDRLVHTGQHYDPRMSGDFFDQLGFVGRYLPFHRRRTERVSLYYL